MSGPTVSASMGNRYDTRYLINGELTLEKYTLQFADAGEHPWSSFHAMVSSLPWDFGEQAFSHYLIAKDLGVPITAIPVFPSRFFPQLGAAVSVQADISEPKDLEGKRVGVMGFGYNPAVWMRQILKDEYGVDVGKIVWIEDENDKFLGGLPYPKPKEYHIEKVRGFDSLAITGKTLGAVTALEEGLFDAFFAPGGGLPLTPQLRRLFPDSEQTLESWLNRGGVFPINTLITVRDETVKQYPDLPRLLFDVMQKARQKYHTADMPTDEDHLGIPCDFLCRYGLFPDAHGLEANREAVQFMIDSCFEQGLIKRRYTPEEILLPLN